MPKITLITSGHYWSDASTHPLVMLVDTDLLELHEMYHDWYNGKEDGISKIYDKYMSFVGWLVKSGYAREVTDDEVTTFFDD